MKKFGFIFIIAAILSSCSSNKKGFVLSGNLSNMGGEMIYLKAMKVNNLEPIDSMAVDESGNFSFKEDLLFPNFFILQKNDKDYITLIINPGEHISISGDGENMLENYEITGSDDSKLLKDFTGHLMSSVQKMMDLQQVYYDSIKSTNLSTITTELTQKSDKITQEMRQFTISFIEKNTGSLASLMALYQQLAPRQYILDPSADFSYYALVDSVLNEKYPESEPVKTLHAHVTDLRERKKIDDLRNKVLGLGKVPPEIALPAPNGDTLFLSSTRGSVVLLDFWASWCSPCRQENPNLVKAYKKYKADGFQIFQVSLDKTRENWLKGIQDDHLGNWLHVSDLKFWQSSVVPLYQIQGIPTSFLLDRDGKIIGKNLRGEALEKKLAEVFSK